MSKRNNTKYSEEDYRTLYPKYSDSEILKILKRRHLYRPEAADLAVKIAVNRKLISSESDLERFKFEGDKPLKRSFFPKIEKEKTKIKLRKSITLNLFFVSLIPIFWGLIRYREGLMVEAIALIAGGLLWATLTLLVRSYINRNLLYAMIFLWFVGIIYTIYVLITHQYLQIMYIVSFGILFTFILYGVVYLYKLSKMDINQ